MRGRFLLCFALMFRIATAEAAVPEVRTVDFYPSGARFVFRVEAKGNFEFSLPGAFIPDSVRPVKQEDVSSLRVENLPREQWTPPALAKLRERIDAKDRVLKLQEGRRNALSQTLAMINGPLPRDVGGKDLILYIEDAQAMRVRIGSELVDLDFDIEKSKRELTAMKNEYDRRMPDGAESVVRVSGTAVSESILFEALTHSAGWSVRYDMNLDSTTGNIGAKMSARVWQRTGIDVAGEFAFHTRQPSHAIIPPDVRPLVVSLADRNLRERAYAPPPMAGVLMQAPVMNKMQLEDALPASPAMTSTLADVSVKGKGDLKGDGTLEDVLLGRLDLKSTPVLVSIPERNREAWIIASMDSIPEPLLPGEAELAVDGASTGRSVVPEYGRGQTYLPFGMAARLTAKKEPLVGKTGSSWTGKGVLEDGYTLEITNGMNTAREVTVRDRIPVPSDEKITLEVKKIDPAPAERDRENRLTWKISLRPGETKKITVEYALRYPGDETLEYR